jgi:hypothetical protein
VTNADCGDAGMVCTSGGTCGCTADSQCGGTRPYCYTASARCVACLTNANCGDGGGTCTANHTCM